MMCIASTAIGAVTPTCNFPLHAQFRELTFRKEFVELSFSIANRGKAPLYLAVDQDATGVSIKYNTMTAYSALATPELLEPIGPQMGSFNAFVQQKTIMLKPEIEFIGTTHILWSMMSRGDFRNINFTLVINDRPLTTSTSPDGDYEELRQWSRSICIHEMHGTFIVTNSVQAK